MPYKTVQDAVKKHPNLNKYSDKAKSGWLKSFNNAYESKKDESYAFSVAYSVANKIDGKSSSMNKIAREILKVAKVVDDHIAIELLRIARMTVIDAYDVMELGESADTSDLKNRYRSLSMKNHPDRGGEATKMVEINEAYDMLKDSIGQKDYFRKEHDKRKEENKRNEEMLKKQSKDFEKMIRKSESKYRTWFANFSNMKTFKVDVKSVKASNFTVTVSIDLDGDDFAEMEFTHYVDGLVSGDKYYYNSFVYHNKKFKMQQARYSTTESVSDFVNPKFMFPERRLKKIFSDKGKSDGKLKKKDFYALLRKKFYAEDSSRGNTVIPLADNIYLVIYRLVWQREPFWGVNGVYEKYSRIDMPKLKIIPETVEGFKILEKFIKDLKRKYG